MRNDLLFLTLKTFSATGGIEKVCRIAGKAMYENATRFQRRIKIFSMHDRQEDVFDNPYFPSEIFTGYNASKARFVEEAVREGCKSKVVILSHINLLLAGWLIKKFCPQTRLVLFAHGIEIWNKLPAYKRKMLECCDEIVSVSRYTADKIMETHGIPAEKCSVLNNCLDPFLPLPVNVVVKEKLYSKYHFTHQDKILFTLSRLSHTERYKGYDNVLEALATIDAPNVKYLIAGSYDKKEKSYLDEKINRLGLQNRVALAGFVPDEDLAAHFALADVYVMPSWKEGFGIVFIEAMYYGLPVIAGNADGSVDALKNGELGMLVNPQSTSEIREAILTMLSDPGSHKLDPALLEEYFSYESYKVKINCLIARNLEEKQPVDSLMR